MADDYGFASSPEPDGNETYGNQSYTTIVLATSGAAAWLAFLMSVHLIYQHLRHWTYPRHQAYIVRILLMCPIYAFDSWLSLWFYHYQIYFDLARDAYEAYVLYQFFALLVMYVEDGDEEERTCVEVLHVKDKMKHPIPLCCLPKYQPGPVFLIYEYRCVLQYVVLKCLCAVIAAILEGIGVYNLGSFSPKYGYLYICITVNVSVSIALYCLILFYLTAKKELEPFKPFAKLLAIKAILFFAFWQSVAISILSWLDVLPAINPWTKEEVAHSLNNYIICFEMLILAICHYWVFPGDEYSHLEPDDSPKISGQKKLKKATSSFARDVLNQNDMIKDFKHNFGFTKMGEAKTKQRKMRAEKASRKEASDAAHQSIESEEEGQVSIESSSLKKKSSSSSKDANYGSTSRRESRDSGREEKRTSSSKRRSRSSSRSKKDYDVV